MEAMSTEDMGFKPEMRRLDETDMRLPLDIDEWEERADATEEEGEEDRGVDMSELEWLGAYDAIGTIGGRRKEREGEEAGVEGGNNKSDGSPWQ